MQNVYVYIIEGLSTVVVSSVGWYLALVVNRFLARKDKMEEEIQDSRIKLAYNEGFRDGRGELRMERGYEKDRGVSKEIDSSKRSS